MSETPPPTANLTVVMADAHAPGNSTIIGGSSAEQSSLSALSEAQQNFTTYVEEKLKRDKGRAKAALDVEEVTLVPWLGLVPMTEYNNREQRRIQVLNNCFFSLTDAYLAYSDHVNTPGCIMK